MSFVVDVGNITLLGDYIFGILLMIHVDSHLNANNSSFILGYYLIPSILLQKTFITAEKDYQSLGDLKDLLQIGVVSRAVHFSTDRLLLNPCGSV